VRLQGESDRRGLVLIAVVLAAIVVIAAAYLVFIAPAA
jgi:hypothetical protein